MASAHPQDGANAYGFEGDMSVYNKHPKKGVGANIGAIAYILLKGCNPPPFRPRSVLYMKPGKLTVIAAYL